MPKYLKNTTLVDIDLKETGDRLGASSTTLVDPVKYQYYAKPEALVELTPYITSGDVIVADGTQDLTVANGVSLDRAIDFIKIPDAAFNQRFLSEPERSNGFLAKNTQEAIEEARSGSAVTGRTFIIEFSNNGNTANKWLEHIPTSEASDTLPYHCAWDLEIFGVSFSNKNTMVDCDVEIYVNGTNNPSKVYTLQVRGYRHYYHTTLSSLFSVEAGDDISIFIKKVGQATPSAVDVELNMRINSTNVGFGGAN